MKLSITAILRYHALIANVKRMHEYAKCQVLTNITYVKYAHTWQNESYTTDIDYCFYCCASTMRFRYLKGQLYRFLLFRIFILTCCYDGLAISGDKTVQKKIFQFCVNTIIYSVLFGRLFIFILFNARLIQRPLKWSS